MSAFFDDLERELRGATVRRAAAERAARVSLLRRAPIAAAVAAIVLLALGAGAAVLALRPAQPHQATGQRQGTEPTSRQPYVSDEPAERALTESLGVLRSPQRADERDPDAVRSASNVLLAIDELPSDLRRGDRSAEHSVVLLPSVRRAAAGAWGALWLVPYRPGTRAREQGAIGTGDRIAAVLVLRPPAMARGVASGVAVLPPPAAIARWGRTMGVSSGRSRVAAAIVPDGVARVGWEFRGSSRTRVSTVQRNVAVLADTAARPLRLTWYDARGDVIKRFAPRP